MVSGGWFSSIPIWASFGITVLLVLVSIRIGIVLGRVRLRHKGSENDSPISTVVGATLGLLAFILAFTFGLTASRFDARKQFLLEEANAIETTYLRADLIPESHRKDVRDLLRRYVDLRMEIAQNPETFTRNTQQAEEIQKKLWSHAAALAEEEIKNPDIASLFVDSLNQMIDLQTNRVVVATVYHIPWQMWSALGVVTVCSMMLVGYLFGESPKSNWWIAIILSLAFSCIITLIVALDGTGAKSAIRVNHKPIQDLQVKFQVDDTAK